MERAIILAAGLSSRLYPRTELRPKPLLALDSGQTLLDRQLAQLHRCGVAETLVVTGHGAQAVEAHLEGLADESVVTRHFPDFAKRGNLHTLHHVRDWAQGPLWIVFADVLAADDLWTRLAAAEESRALLIDEGLSIPGTMRALLRGGQVTNLGPHIPVDVGEATFVGLARFDAAAMEQLMQRVAKMADDPKWVQAIYTDALASLAAEGVPLTSIPTAGLDWIEVDDEGDYGVARRMAASWPR